MSLLVVDVSSNQSHPIDYAAVKAAGVSGAVVKLTEGTKYVNPFAQQDILGFRKVGIPVAGYHFVHPELPALQQVSWLKSHLFGCKFVWIDSELAYNGSTNWNMTPEQWAKVSAVTKEIIDSTASFANVGLYSSPGFIADLPGAPWGKHLWLADYGPSSPPSQCLMWQYTRTGTVAGINNPVDLSHFYGTEAALKALFEPTPAPDISVEDEQVWIDKLPVEVSGQAKGSPILVVPSQAGYYILGPDFVTYYEKNGIKKSPVAIAAGDFARLKNLGVI